MRFCVNVGSRRECYSTKFFAQCCFVSRFTKQPIDAAFASDESSMMNRKEYQVIDEIYDDSNGSNVPGSLLNTFNAGMDYVTGRGPENQPLMETTGGSYGTTGPSRPVPQMDSNHQERRKWDHIVDLDQFFSFIYEYHQEGGYVCICTKKVLSLTLSIFIAVFSTFFAQCVDYDVVFANKNASTAGRPIVGKTHIDDVIVQNCASHLNLFVIICLFVSTFYWMASAVKITHYLLQMNEIRQFYKSILEIPDSELPSHTWNSILRKLCKVQARLHLAINCDQLKPIDVYHRILRMEHYFIAMINQIVLLPVFEVPLLGQMTYLPTCFIDNLRRCLFTSSSSPWQGPCLKDEYKDNAKLNRLSEEMQTQVTWCAGVNLVLMPFIFIYQLLFTLFHIAELARKSADGLASRTYSNYGRYKVRHFHELDHELKARLNRSHKAATAYLNQFHSQILKIFAQHIRLMAGATACVLLALSMWDEDVLQIDHVITIIGICGGLVVVCSSLIPEENLVYQPEELMTQVVSEVQCVPAEWKGKAHTPVVRKEFEQLFHPKWMFLLHEISSPLLAPFILYFWVRPRCIDFVYFFHEHTDSLRETGDVCSFALLDVTRHGDSKWNGSDQSTDIVQSSALDGKTELSALHFATLYPDWKPTSATEAFLEKFRARMEKDAQGMARGTKNLLNEAVHSLNTDARNGREGQQKPSQPKEGSVADSLRQNGVDIDEPGASMRVQTLFLRGIHRERQQASTRPTARFGANTAPHDPESLFSVPQTINMGGGGEPNRNNARPAFQVESIEENQEEEERPPSSFMV